MYCTYRGSVDCVLCIVAVLRGCGVMMWNGMECERGF